MKAASETVYYNAKEYVKNLTEEGVEGELLDNAKDAKKLAHTGVIIAKAKLQAAQVKQEKFEEDTTITTTTEEEVDEESKVEAALNQTTDEKIKVLGIQLDIAKDNFAENTKDLLKKKRAAKRLGLNKTAQINATAAYQKAEVLEEGYEKKVQNIQEKIDILEMEQEEETKATEKMEQKIVDYEEAAKGKVAKEKAK